MNKEMKIDMELNKRTIVMEDDFNDYVIKKTDLDEIKVEVTYGEFPGYPGYRASYQILTDGKLTEISDKELRPEVDWDGPHELKCEVKGASFIYIEQRYEAPMKMTSCTAGESYSYKLYIAKETSLMELINSIEEKHIKISDIYVKDLEERRYNERMKKILDMFIEEYRESEES